MVFRHNFGEKPHCFTKVRRVWCDVGGVCAPPCIAVCGVVWEVCVSPLVLLCVVWCGRCVCVLCDPLVLLCVVWCGVGSVYCETPLYCCMCVVWAVCVLCDPLVLLHVCGVGGVCTV